MQIAFVNGKGGVGKSTIALMVAATLRDAGHDACIDDRDPQQSAAILAPNLGVPLGLSAGIVIIDTAPRLDHEPTLSAIRDADIVVLVSSPSPADLSTTARTAAIIREIRNEGRPSRILFNSVQLNTRLAAGLKDLKTQLVFPTLNNHLVRRQAYQLATLQGWKELTQEAREELLKVSLDILALRT
jgi:chromosome partitioning protein